MNAVMLRLTTAAMKPGRRQRLLPVVLAVGCVTVTVAALQAFGIVINDTPSLPLGFYRKQPNRPLEKGCFVLFELPEAETATRPYARGRLIKQVAATAGDRVAVGPTGVFVNGSRLDNSAQAEHDIHGQPLPRLVLQDCVLEPGELLVMSGYHPRSFDGRYFGPIQSREILSVLAPVWTWDDIQP